MGGLPRVTQLVGGTVGFEFSVVMINYCLPERGQGSSLRWGARSNKTTLLNNKLLCLPQGVLGDECWPEHSAKGHSGSLSWD